MTINVVSDSAYFPKGHGVHTAFLNQVAMLRAQKDITVLVNSRKRADVTHIHTLGALGLWALLRNKPTVVTAHVIPESFIGSLIGARYWGGASTRYLRFFYNKANLVLAVAPVVKTRLEEIGVTTKITVFPNPIDTNRFKHDQEKRQEGRKQLGLSDSDFVLIASGQIQERKGVKDFIETAQKLPEYTFIWLGGAPFKKITAQSRELSTLLAHLPKNVLFPGMISYERMPLYYSVADAFLFPSYQENAPMAPIEAASAGLPLILRDIPEYKLLYKTDYLTAKTQEEFIKLTQKLAKDKDFYKKARVEALNLSKRFSFDTMADKLIREYQSLLT